MFTIDQVDRNALQQLVDNAIAWDIDVAAICRRAGVDYTRLEHISFERYLALQNALNAAARHAVHSAVGQRAFSQEEYEINFHYMLGADDLGEALVRMKKFAAMLAERLGNGAIHLSTDRGQIASLYIRPGVDAETVQRFAAYFTQDNCKLIEMMAWMIGTPIPLIQLEVPFAATPALERQLQRFGCPVEHGHSGFRFFFPATLLRKPIVRSLQELKSFLKILPAVFVSGDHDTLALDQRIERILEKQCLEVGGMPSASQLASALNMSEATLRRRLRDTGRSFSEIKQGCQLRLSKKLLSMSYRSLHEVANLLGYQDVNAFRRAFKQATGHTPMSYRDSCKPAADAASQG